MLTNYKNALLNTERVLMIKGNWVFFDTGATEWIGDQVEVAPPASAVESSMPTMSLESNALSISD